jgi:hypothetical protein
LQSLTSLQDLLKPLTGEIGNRFKERSLAENRREPRLPKPYYARGSDFQDRCLKPTPYRGIGAGLPETVELATILESW